MSNRPPRLTRVFQSIDSPVYFVTFNTFRRQPFLAEDSVHEAFRAFAGAGMERGVGIGRYVLMPDHAHLFVRGAADFRLAQWVRLLKRAVSKVISGSSPHWQEGFFDHVMRSSESYSAKWEYVRQNPVRAGLAAVPEEWPYAGQIVDIFL
ncbi:MAG: transposase [Terrimicrobiaceae bacterium]